MARVGLHDLLVDDLDELTALKLVLQYKLLGHVAHKISYLHEGR